MGNRSVHVVTGGTRGIGAATVELLAADPGNHVIFCGRDRAAGHELREKLGDNVEFIPADLTRADDVEAFFDAVEPHGADLVGAFNAAGVIGTDTILRGTRFHDSTEAQFDAVFDLNVKALWRCVRRELRIMSANATGSIVNCSSVAGLRAADSLSVSYTASKHAVVGLTRALAAEYARDNIRVNAVCPGVIDTDMVAGLQPQLLAHLQAKNPAARLGTPQEVATVVHFLLSPRASYINGTAIPIDAGGLYGAL
ncbi:NAD(P)-dependent dehydrogenase (short-subunit alcohol dehydrogenase family) [Nocardia tenerifensis]|uniref:NAD(P)-dependent dehydrogenase (Short-subunit alcohol dehydrogenase family) n=1 Tax=Nocardia tenerifensis TaxID=228006 RepID=A0A318K694_9NOCA|nr:SDR family NAD(P)-dependent oxidoreductase [Nocardia tenerifensis]PXX68878.1 NAD(P)-dependent dehydrogenase (short-subunit alcohol dehydrogenase family) [Nocardia tenerifensis]